MESASITILYQETAFFRSHLPRNWSFHIVLISGISACKKSLEIKKVIMRIK